MSISTILLLRVVDPYRVRYRYALSIIHYTKWLKNMETIRSDKLIFILRDSIFNIWWNFVFKYFFKIKTPNFFTRSRHYRIRKAKLWLSEYDDAPYVESVPNTHKLLVLKISQHIEYVVHSRCSTVLFLPKILKHYGIKEIENKCNYEPSKNHSKPSEQNKSIKHTKYSQ